MKPFFEMTASYYTARCLRNQARFLRVLPPLPLFSTVEIGAKLGKPPSSGHSHSIVLVAYKHQKIRDFFSRRARIIVTSTAKKFRLRAIDGDRSRSVTTGKRESKRCHRIWVQV